MKSNYLFCVMLLLVFAQLGCKKDEKTACELLVGEWQCTSWREDGVETLGSAAFISSSNWDFDTPTGNKGDWDVTIVYVDGSTDALNGDYETNANCTEVTVTESGDSEDLDFSIANDKLTLKGNLDGTFVELQFKRD